MIGPYREPDTHFDEMEEFLLLVSRAMNYAYIMQNVHCKPEVKLENIYDF